MLCNCERFFVIDLLMRGLKFCDGMVNRVNPNKTSLSGERYLDSLKYSKK